jgi:hypothetical protein
MFCKVDLSGVDAYTKAILVPTDHCAESVDALDTNCSSEDSAYSVVAGACAVAAGKNKTSAAAGASASTIEAVKTAEDIGKVVVISIASVPSAAAVSGPVYDAARNPDRSHQREVLTFPRRCSAQRGNGSPTRLSDPLAEHHGDPKTVEVRNKRRRMQRRG